MANDVMAPMADATRLPWEKHDRIEGILMKTLLTSADNALANVALVQIPVGGEVTRHSHKEEVETVYVLAGESILVLGDEETPFRIGQIIAIPKGLEHAVINVGNTPVELLTFFTPPLA